ncbi:MAG: hypothetical protein PHS44_02085 [Candidatus Dojkabacteria bacterium]|jgi:hypothetical protein|nr:hypothetical protein [Candidatus Dojkabacteria bacterium]
MLTADDLQKIAVLINESVKQAKDELMIKLDHKVDKKDLLELKDMVIGIRNELDTEHNLRYQKLEQVESDLECIKKQLHLKD